MMIVPVQDYVQIPE